MHSTRSSMQFLSTRVSEHFSLSRYNACMRAKTARLLAVSLWVFLLIPAVLIAQIDDTPSRPTGVYCPQLVHFE